MNNIENVFMKNIKGHIDNAIYTEVLRDYAAIDCEEFNKNAQLLSVCSSKGGSTIRVSIDNKIKRYQTDKPVNFWHGMEGETVKIKGTLVKEEKGKKLIILSASSEITLEQVLGEYDKLKASKEDAAFDKLKPEQKKYLSSISQRIADLSSCNDTSKGCTDRENESGECIVKMTSIEELQTLYRVIKKFLPAEVCAEVERCFSDVKGIGSNTEKQNSKKVLYYLLNNDWIGDNVQYDVSEVERTLKNTLVGMDYPMRQLIKELVAVNHSNDKIPKVILLSGKEGCGKTSLAEVFFKAMGIKCASLNVAGKNDPETYTGTGRVYENARPSILFTKCFEVGMRGGIILEEIDKVGPKCVDALLSFVDRKISDDFLEIGINIKQRWIICTANEVDKIPPAMLSRMKIIKVDEYTEAEKVEIINKCILPAVCRNRNMEPFMFSDAVCHKIICEFAAGKSIRMVKEVVEEIVNTVLYRGDCVADITIENIGKYYNFGEDIERIKSSFEREYSGIERKFRALYNNYSENLKKRNEELVEMVIHGTAEEKRYALSSLKYTVNVLNEEVKTIDVKKIEQLMDESHYGLHKVKREILRTMASNALTGCKGKIILLNGCPGVGKTSICKTIAKALDRKFVKVSLNGVATAETLKGFPRTVKDSQPGVIVQGLAKEEVCSYSAVVLLDEVDKMIVNEKSDPYTALHDMLDNNSGYYDQYLETTIPTENILFILTSNDKSRIPSTILDRVKVIEVDGYTEAEKKMIAQHYVLPKFARRYQLDKINMDSEVLNRLIQDYCTSYGIRDVERAVEGVIEEVALKSELKLRNEISIGLLDLRNALGAIHNGGNSYPERREDVYGQARALAVMGNHGVSFGIQIVENPFGKEEMEVTGLAKGSFAESIKVARTLVCQKLNCPMPKIHIHALDSAVEKDGPSAGLTLFVCMMSFLLKKPLPNVAFTGTVDLFGNVGIIGGDKLKILAAERAGVDMVFLPQANYDRLVADNEINNCNVQLFPVSTVEQVVQVLFGEACATKEGVYGV